MNELAIVIPAYKSYFLERVLRSLAEQKNNKFNLYVGDDNSPENLYAIISQYETRINLVYKRFTDNLGQKDLVAQWERCIDLVGDEKWIWLFSDDDLMEPTCVENFYKDMQQNPDFDLFHFDVNRIDASDNTIGHFYTFPEIMTSEDFLRKRLTTGSFSAVVEYVFRKSHFLKCGRFQNFDLAWCSDDATWIKLGKRKGIKTIKDSKVNWRESNINISNNNNDKEIHLRKLYAQIEFVRWIISQVTQNEINLVIDPTKKQLKKWFFESIQFRSKYLSFGNIMELSEKLYLVMDNTHCPKQEILYLFLFKIYSSVSGIMARTI